MMNNNTFIVIHTLDGIEYADKYFKTEQEANEYAEGLRFRYRAFEPSRYVIEVISPV